MARTASLPPWITPAWLRKVRSKILPWYADDGRSLPWRSTHDPYAIWISEIMLQQTQVATVIPYYARFLTKFPDIKSLAQANETDVMRHWEGLGYYRRARQMHDAAQRIQSHHDGVFPRDFDSILNLPGIGRYTAGAIASFAYDDPQPIVEANTQRLYARLCLMDQPLTAPDSQRILWEFASAIVEPGPAGQINQSLMELGATMCTPKQPSCDRCPLKSLCPTFKEGRQEEIPAPKPAKVYHSKTDVVLLFQNRQKRWLVRKCRDGEHWAGLWDFPRFDMTHASEASLPQAIDSACRQRFGRGCLLGAVLGSLKHGVTKYRITLHCHHATWIPNSKKLKTEEEIQWLTLEELSNVALSSTGRKIWQLLLKSNPQRAS